MTTGQRNRIKGLLNINKTEEIDKYLGCPVVKGRPDRQMFRETISKMESQLAN